MKRIWPTCAIAIALLAGGCEQCEQEIDANAAETREAYASCYRAPPAEVLEAARAVLADHDLDLARDDDERLHLETEWSDITLNSTRLSPDGDPTRVRLDVVVVPDDCARVIVHAERERWAEGRSSEARRWVTSPNGSDGTAVRREIHTRLAGSAHPERRQGWRSR